MMIFTLFWTFAFPLICSALLVNSSDGTAIYATGAGNPQNPGLVFTHGFALSGFVFDKLFKNQLLLDHFYLVSYDLRGHGRSGKPTSADAYTSKLFANDFHAVSTAFNLTSPVLVGWSYGASIVSDIFTYLPPDAISGFISAAGIPYLGLTNLNTPLSLTYLQGIFSTDDVDLYSTSKIAFVDSCFFNSDNVSVEVKWSWLGATIMQFPTIGSLLIARTQNATSFYLAGSAGFPILLLSGTADMVVEDDSVTSQILPHFPKGQVHKIQGGSHALFFDNEDAFVKAVIRFATNITTGNIGS